MILKTIQQLFHSELDLLYDVKEVDHFFFMLCKAYFNIDRLTLALSPELNISKADGTTIFKALSKLKLGKPIQYILGVTTFFEMEFKVNKHTLIPRPETEDLVRSILKNVSKDKTVSILDIGTGSGCIAIALAKQLPKAKITALDISNKALQVAKKNATKNNVTVHFIKGDILAADFKMKPLMFDIIVSNPPYVRDLEKKQMHANVLDYEPASALFVSNEKPLIFYEAIVDFAKEHLTNNGMLYFEINQYLGTEMKALLTANGFKNISLHRDIFDMDRILIAHLP